LLDNLIERIVEHLGEDAWSSVEGGKPKAKKCSISFVSRKLKKFKLRFERKGLEI